MAGLPQITDAESLVMEVLWAGAPRTADEIVAALAGNAEWQEATIKTFLNRLLKKGVIRAEYQGRRYLYSPVLARADWVDTQSRSVLNRLFGGRVAPLVAHFGERHALSKDDLAELRKLIDRLDR
ncbi:BlaI/MecI/CopY family transcriptional regulator [Massilia norwichensis]|jgi:BlaI family transcriptional regulator, penicillinase repressor|uniref:BlaI/MecI/CopY family transcriptional regulator n=1 Tax=Massilia norwichensis TaxID=1442366 RepID=A0ABT2A9R3_9BURK|nr:BlaI/MecI/CopY family transcriptional regulator [Massilia norwichensis]MCS0590945.1 BlaI/MecI/CopY family transcriptional regulator [Massilia norwichensis]